MPRPPLPYRHANPTFKHPTHPPPVKYQILSCQGKDILVGRLKINTTDGEHAFILRRFDTQAISLTTMFRAAFPNAEEATEKAEVAWVKEHYNLLGTNGSTKEPHITRLAGVWVRSDTALELAAEYNMVDLIQVMVDAVPDPAGQYRRSNKANNQATTVTAPSSGPDSPANQATPIAARRIASPVKAVSSPKPPSKSLPTPSPTSGETLPPAAKRRRAASPASVISTTSIASAATTSSPLTSKSQLPRRSARTKSPAPKSGPQPLTAVTKPRSRASVAPPSPKKKVVALPKSSPVKAEEDEAVEGHVAGNRLYEEDIVEQKQLIADLKAAAASSTKKSEPKQIEVEEDEVMEEEEEEEESRGPSKLKRTRVEDQEPLQFEFKEPEQEERQIATNNRVGMQPRAKSLAWGLAAFAVGMGAVSFLPNFF
ncbi:hypothetical protein FA15DRAFT_665574 [Coprinopsis marcescibilis]|uniref:HTH APSES-type domain-containing protein n=1 Tax=Coprinopsis marcescibilis TaxID=230819 RepID=A0A5C3L602_COPMA|nr:hypothetical protein FA15DRAFT_665574 [Coprinopsis marcescibilis]